MMENQKLSSSSEHAPSEVHENYSEIRAILDEDIPDIYAELFDGKGERTYFLSTYGVIMEIQKLHCSSRFMPEREKLPIIINLYDENGVCLKTITKPYGANYASMLLRFPLGFFQSDFCKLSDRPSFLKRPNLRYSIDSLIEPYYEES